MRILVVDLSNVFWSVALGGQLKNTNAARGIVVKEIGDLAISGRYDRVAVVCDGKGKSFRTALWPAYKADRVQRPDHLWSLLADTVAHARAAGWHVFDAPQTPDGWLEADDLAATVVAYAVEHEHAADILTGDSDLAQLVNDDRGVRFLRRYKGISPLDEAGVKAWLGVPPSAVVDLKALAGDSGDGYGNIFPGLGEKTAIKMLEASGWDAEAAVTATINSDKDYAVGRTIRSLGLERLHVGRSLARLVSVAPIDVDSLAEPLEVTTPPDVLGNFIPDESDDDAPPIEGEPVSAAAAQRVPAHVWDPSPATSAITRVDTSMRMGLPAEEAFGRLVEFRAFVKRCLVPGTDYGVIPGCQKPTLFKPGAEKLAEIYSLAPEFEGVSTIERWDEPVLFFYRVRCRLFTKRDRVVVAECIGSANSKESKYAGRWAYEREVPPHLDLERLKKKEFTMRKGERAGQVVTQYRVPNEDIFDQVNTLDKMAQKRAMVGAVILATRSGGIFTQDAEDIPAAAFGTQSDVPQWEQ